MTACQGDLESLAMAIALRAASDEAMQALTRLSACYLGFYSPSTGGDPVARFHLDNGARLERLNALGDLFTKGVKQSFGMIVNHLYDLQKVEVRHEKFSHGEVAYSRALAAWL